MTEGRPTTVDYQRMAQLQYLGNYVRKLPVNMARMMENALDWEHLAHVHASSFSAIELVECGRWGWRARALPAGSDEWQVLELLLDAQRHYWATSVLSGPAASIEIHTQASLLGEQAIEVDVRFYSSEPVPQDQAGFYLDVLQQQYALLYDEDERLMQGRQSALDERALERSSSNRAISERGAQLRVGAAADLSRDEPNTVATDYGRYCVRWFNGGWIAHSAVCPHMLGPLDTAPIAADDKVYCPWHGYSFDVVTGESTEGKCRPLAPAPQLRERDGMLFMVLGGSE